MTRMSRRLPFLLAATLGLATLGGCSTSSYEVSFQMQPGHAATVAVGGPGAFLTVANDGPGVITVTDPWGVPQELIRGARGRTMQPDEQVRIETLDEAAFVRVAAQRATGFTLNGPLPK